MDFDVLQTRVTHHLATGRDAEAISLLKDNLNDYQHVAEFWIFYTACHLNLEQWDDAEATARTALTLNPEHPVAGEQLAVALSSLHRRDEALAVIQQVITVAPEYARGHYLLGMILLGHVQNNDERILARQATEHALKLDPENPDFYQGATLAADLADDQNSALGFLEAGLRMDPHHQGLLRAAGSIKNGHKVVGDQGVLLRGMLASDPMNEKLHGDYAENFLEKQVVYADRWWLFTPILAVIAAFGYGGGSLGKIVVIALVLVGAGVFAWWNISTYKKTAKSFPSGYLKDIHARFPTLPKAVRAYQGSWVLAVAGALAGCFVPLAGAILMILGIVASRVAATLIRRENSAPPADRTDPEERRVHLIRLSGGLAAGFWKRVLLVIAHLIFFGVAVSQTNHMATVPLASVGLELLVIGGVLAYCQFRLGFKNNAFAYGLAVGASAKSRNFALLRGNIGGIYFIGLHLVIGLIAFSAALSLLMQSPESIGATDNSVDEQPSGEVEEPSQTPTIPTQIPSAKPEDFSITPLPELPDLPSLDQ